MASDVDVHTDHTFLSDFVWAAVGGTVVLAACASLLTLSLNLDGTLLGAPVQAGGAAASPTDYASLAGVFMAGSLVVLVVRSLTARER